MEARLKDRRDKAFSLSAPGGLGPSKSRDLRGFCLFIYATNYFDYRQKKPLKYHAPPVFTGVNNYGFL